jgi:hypothetical protein
MLGHEKDFHRIFVEPLLHEPAGLQAIHARHGYVKNHDIWLQAFNLLECFHAIRRFADYFPAGPAFEKSP